MNNKLEMFLSEFEFNEPTTKQEIKDLNKRVNINFLK